MHLCTHIISYHVQHTSTLAVRMSFAHLVELDRGVRGVVEVAAVLEVGLVAVERRRDLARVHHLPHKLTYIQHKLTSRGHRLTPHKLTYIQHKPTPRGHGLTPHKLTYMQHKLTPRGHRLTRRRASARALARPHHPPPLTACVHSPRARRGRIRDAHAMLPSAVLARLESTLYWHA